MSPRKRRTARNSRHFYATAVKRCSPVKAQNLTMMQVRQMMSAAHTFLWQRGHEVGSLASHFLLIMLLLSGVSLGVGATATMAQAPPAPWVSVDIGPPPSGGTTGYLTGVFTIGASGTDIYLNSETFRYVYQPVVGDVEIVARVIQADNPSNPNTNEYAQAGIMIRETLTTTSRHATIGVMDSGRVKFRVRQNISGSTTSDGPSADATIPPYWIKLIRKGNTFYGYRSADNINWVFTGSKIIPMASNAFMGLAVTSVASTLTTAKVDSVSIRLPKPWLNQDISVAGPKGSTSYQSEPGIASAGGTYTIKAAGADIAGTSDGLHYVYQSLTGNGEIIAKLTAISSPTGGTPVGGVMIRQGMGANSQHASMTIFPSGTIKFRYRTSPGSGTTIVTATPTTPKWVRVTRTVNSFRGYYSSDGVTWTQVGNTATISMNDPVAAGLAVSNRSDTALATATFDNVTFPQADGKWSQPIDLNYVVIHAHVLPNGKLLLWSRDDLPSNQTFDNTGGGNHARVWDPNAAPTSFTLVPIHKDVTDIFCTGHGFLPDGKLLVTGGHHLDNFGLPDTNIFDFSVGAAGTWSAKPVMNRGRWYPTNCILGNGNRLFRFFRKGHNI